MHYVYILESALDGRHWYIGVTSNLQKHLEEHNAGDSLHTNKFKPWKLKSYTAFTTREQAEKFERYLKSNSGRVFAKRHL